MTRHHYTKATVALAITVALAVGAAVPAAARFDLNWPPVAQQHTQATSRTSTNLCSEVCSGGGYTSANQQPPATAAKTANVARIVAHGTGFDWAAAGIGAAVGLGLSILGIWTAVAVSQRRALRSQGSPAVTS